MPKEIKPEDETSLPSSSQVSGDDPANTEPQTGFRHWMSENQSSLPALMLIIAYATVILYLIFLLVFGGPSVITKILTGILIGSLFVAYVVFRFSQPLDEEGHTIWDFRRAPQTERFEKVVAVVLWSFIAISLCLLLLYARAHQAR
jgi:ABC-type Fe3+-siderophore transport system permease subunit